MSSPLQDPVPLADLRRALVTKLRHHGDVLLAAPVFTALQRAAPGLEIDALVYRETAPMLEDHPCVARLHTIDRDWKRQGWTTQVAREWTLLRTLRSRRFDLLIHLTEHPRGLVLARLLSPRYAVTRERNRHARTWARQFTHFYRLPRATPRHAVEANLDALRRIGVQPAEADKALSLVPGAAAQARAGGLLAQHGLAPRGFLQVHPGSRWLFKCWPAERTAALIGALVGEGHTVVLTGAPDADERGLVAAIVAALPAAARRRVVDVSGALTLRELAALTGLARLFIGVDSAPMHIAAAMGTPAVALFGPSGEHEWGPWRVPARVVASTGHACRPCGIDGCGGGKVSECLTTLPVGRVHDAVRDLLRATDGA